MGSMMASICSLSSASFLPDRAAASMVDQAAVAIGLDGYSGLMRQPVDRFVLEVDPVRRKKHEYQDQRDHDVVVQAAPLVRPQDVPAYYAPDRIHRQAGSAGNRRACLYVFQV